MLKGDGQGSNKSNASSMEGGITMAILAKPISRAIIIDAKKEEQFLLDSKRNAPNSQRICELKRMAKLIPFKEVDK